MIPLINRTLSLNGSAERADPQVHPSPTDGRTMPEVITGGALCRIAMLGNHVPRQCGIATFTTDLSAAITTEFSALDCFVVAMNDAGKRHAYPTRVRFEVAESDVASYRRAADFLNVNTVDVVCVQHEYGIFGGKAGATSSTSSASSACRS